MDIERFVFVRVCVCVQKYKIVYLIFLTKTSQEKWNISYPIYAVFRKIWHLEVQAFFFLF